MAYDEYPDEIISTTIIQFPTQLFKKIGIHFGDKILAALT